MTSAPVGAGPFKMDSWTRDSKMELSKNPDWKVTPVYLDKLTLQPLETRIIATQSQRPPQAAVADWFAKLALWWRPKRAAAIRGSIEGLGRMTFYLGVPAWLLLRIVAG